MMERAHVIKAIHAVFEREPRINLHRHPVHIEFQDGLATLEGEAEHVAAKKLAMELAVAVPGVSGIVDRLHVVPASRMGRGDSGCRARCAAPGRCLRYLYAEGEKKRGRVETIREAPTDPEQWETIPFKDIQFGLWFSA